MQIPRELQAPVDANARLARPAEWLSRALHEAGYANLAFYDVPGGFAIVTGLELIDDQGLATPHPDSSMRFSVKSPDWPFFTMRFWSDLLVHTSGRFRLFVFVVRDQPFVYSKDVTDPEVVWKHPATELPPSRAEAPYTPEDKWYALVYEVEHPPSSDHVRLVEQPSPPSAHLDKSGILAALAHVAELEAHKGLDAATQR
jgi:hypothetical protein